ncbi:MAG: hypothetical protein IJ215_00100 [Clostridia bacterium]|nr:hypothetical protein [Clostridia bacterium]
MGIVFDYTDVRVFVVAILFFLVMNFVGYQTKKAWFPMACSILSLAMVIVHIKLRSIFTNGEIIFNVCTDLAFLAISTAFLLVVDEIESRRSIIKNVFGSRYRKKK